MRKHRVLQALEGIPEELGSMSIDDAKDMLKTELDEEKSKQDKIEKAVCDKYVGKFIKKFDEKGLFGKIEVEYIRIDEIKPGSMTTEWNRCYDIKGEVVNFAGHFHGMRNMEPGHASDSMTESQLNSCEIITEDQYNEAVKKHAEIEKIIKQMQQK